MNNFTLTINSFWVDNKPFPTEESPESEVGQIFHNGFSGDARHLGWMDLIQLKELIKQYSIEHIILKNLDVLGKAAMITGYAKVCVSYFYKRSCSIKTLPEDYYNCQPVYSAIGFGGWDFSEDDDEIPIRAQEYMIYLLVHTQVTSITYNNNKVNVVTYFDKNNNPKVRILPIC